MSAELFETAVLHEDRESSIISVKKYQSPDIKTSIFQVLSSLFLLLVCYGILYFGLSHHHDWMLVVAPLGSGLAIRTFTLQHDCGHGSLFRARWANDLTGRLCSLLTFTPYDHWQRHHGIHHSGWNNIDCRGRLSDMYSDCITVGEYRAMTPLKRGLYRLSKNPVVALLLMPPIIFFVVYRIPFDTPRDWKRERYGVHMTNVALVALYGCLAYWFNYRLVALVTFLVIYPASVIGVWLFLVQHKFEGVHWGHDATWDPFEASLTGCSFLRLPRILDWFSGSIGFHHVHHSAPGIPNYRLADCHYDHKIFSNVKTIGFWGALKEINNHMLWDETDGKMVPFKSILRQPYEVRPAC